MQELMTVEQCAAWLKVSKQTVRRYAKTGEIPCHRVGRVLRFNADEVMEKLKEQPTMRPERTAKRVANTQKRLEEEL